VRYLYKQLRSSKIWIAMSYASQAGASGRASASQPSKSTAAQEQPGGALYNKSSGGGGSQQQQQEARSKDGRTELELLRDTKRHLCDADYIAGNTMEQLDGQTEQLSRIQRDTDSIDANLDQSEFLLRGLKPFGWVRNLFRADPKPAAVPPGSTRRSSQGSGAPSGGYPSSSSKPAPSSGAARLMADEQARREAKLGSGAQGGRGSEQQKQAEVERAYDDIDNLLDGLKEKSKVINKTLDQHNQVLPGMESSITRQQERINKQQNDMRKIMGK
jgi:hypothetical protein